MMKDWPRNLNLPSYGKKKMWDFDSRKFVAVMLFGTATYALFRDLPNLLLYAIFACIFYIMIERWS